VDDFLNNRKIPPTLADRVRNFYSYVLVREVHADETGKFLIRTVPDHVSSAVEHWHASLLHATSPLGMCGPCLMVHVIHPLSP
jgi:hypothetical protein